MTFWRASLAGLVAVLALLTAVGCQEANAPTNPPIDQPQGPPNPPSNPGGGGRPGPAGQTGSGPGAQAPQPSSWQTFTSPLYSVQWATSELPWFPIGLVIAIAVGYYVGYRKGPSPWE